MSERIPMSERTPGCGTSARIAWSAAIGLALAIAAAVPARATYYASSQLCYGADCSEMGYATPVASTSDSFHRDVDTGVVGQTGSFDENATADAGARRVTFEVGFQGSELVPGVFLGSTPQRPYGSLTLIAFMGAVGEDELTITAPGLVSGFVSLDITLEAGGINACTAVGGCVTGLPFVSPDLDAQFFAQAGGQSAASQLLDEAQLTAPGGFSQQYATDQIPFTAGVPFSVRLGVSGTMALRALLDPSPPELFLSGATLGVTATIVQIHVLDGNGDPVAGVSVASATGTDWTTTVPEASSVASGLAAALALGLLAAGRSEFR